jgi:hypothetical protein
MSKDKSDGNINLSDIFLDNSSDGSSDTKADNNSLDKDLNSDSDSLFDNDEKQQHPPEHYLAEGDRLNIF